MEPGASMTWEALADPTRREILTALAAKELTVTEISEAVTRVGRTAISSHLRILRAAGLVRERRSGKFRHYSVNPVSAVDIVDFLSSVYRGNLDELKAATKASSTSRAKARANFLAG